MQKRLGTVQNFTLTATSQAATDFGSQTYRVRVALTAASTAVGNSGSGAWILFGDTTGLAVSSTNGSLIPAPWAEDFTVTPGQTFYCIESTTNHGTLSLTELT